MSEINTNQTSKIDVFALKKLCRTELVERGILNDHHLCGYSRKSIREFIRHPHKHSLEMIKIIKYVYLNSGYFKKIIQYYTNLVKTDCWTVDTEIGSASLYNVSADTLKANYLKYVKEISTYSLSTELSRILLNVFLYDVCFGFLIETSEGKTIFYFDPEDCRISGHVDGIFTYSVRREREGTAKFLSYPEEVQELMKQPIDKSLPKDLKMYVKIPYEKSFCVKYHDIFDFIFPPFFFIIEEILDIEDFKDLEKRRVENEVYKLLALKIPTNDEGKITLGDELVTPFAELAEDTVSKTIGILPTPFDITPIEFSTNNSDNANNVQNAINELYSELGVSQSLLSGASSGSELKISIEVDASDVYRILKQVDRLINFHCKLRLPTNTSYDFKFRYLEITSFNQDDKTDELLKLSQASCPTKVEMLATRGHNPARMLGNEIVENIVFELGNIWTPLKTSYTQSADSENSENNGRPSMDETEISDSTQVVQDNDSNDPDNRV